MTKSLSEIKAGDKVILFGGSRLSCDSIEVVERTTKCWIILSKDRKFRIRDGWLVGGTSSWSAPRRIKPATPELKEEINRREALRKARHTVCSLAERLKTRCFESDNAADVIPRLQAALAVLETDPTDNNAA